MINGPGFEVFRSDTAEGEDTVGTASDTRCDDGLGPNPNAIFQGDWTCDEVESGCFEVVIPAEQQSTLRNTDVTADDDFCEVVNPNVLPNPSMIADAQFPGIFDGHPRFDDQALADSCAEATEECGFQFRRPWNPGLEEESGKANPEHTLHHIAGVEIRVVEQVETGGCHWLVRLVLAKFAICGISRLLVDF